MYEPELIIRLLNKAKIKFIVMGTHGIGGWRSEPRATHDVDCLVALKDYAKAVHVVREAFPELEVADWKVVTRFRDTVTGNVVIDLMMPMDDLFKSAFRHTVAIGKSHYVPNLELALVSKFAAMISPYRDHEKKHLDANDFINMVRRNRKELNRPNLRALGNKVYNGGGKEILKMIDNVLAGRPINV